QLDFEYDPRTFTRADVERIAEQFVRLLGGLEREREAPVDALEILDEAERHRLLVDFNRTAADFPRDACIHHLFEAQVERTPDRDALVCGGRRFTYAELNARANELAHALCRRRVGPDVRVCLCGGR